MMRCIILLGSTVCSHVCGSHVGFLIDFHLSSAVVSSALLEYGSDSARSYLKGAERSGQGPITQSRWELPNAEPRHQAKTAPMHTGCMPKEDNMSRNAQDFGHYPTSQNEHPSHSGIMSLLPITILSCRRCLLHMYPVLILLVCSDGWAPKSCTLTKPEIGLFKFDLTAANPSSIAGTSPTFSHVCSSIIQ